MTKAVVVSTIFVFVLATTALVYSDKSKVIEQHNKYGGVTEENNYGKGSEEYEKGIYKIVEYYDKNHRIVEIESYYLDDHAKLDGVAKREQYYKNEAFEKTKLKEAQFYYTKEYANKEGIRESKQHYNEHERKTKTEFHYTDSYTRKKNISRLDAVYDSSGSVYRHIYYDKDGKVFSIEEKKDGEFKRVGP